MKQSCFSSFADIFFMRFIDDSAMQPCFETVGETLFELQDSDELFSVGAPIGAMNVTLTLTANADVDIKLTGQNGFTFTPHCVLGQDPECVLQSSGYYTGHLGPMYIEYSGDDMTDPVREDLYIELSTHSLIISIKSNSDNAIGKLECK